MKKLIPLLAVLSITGCAMNNPTKMIKALADDPASSHIQLPTPWGLVIITRTNPGTNSLPHTLDPGGKITVDKRIP